MEALSSLTAMPMRVISMIPGGPIVQGVVTTLVVLLLIKWYSGSVPFGLGEYLGMIPVIGEWYKPSRTDPWDNDHLEYDPATPTVYMPASADFSQASTSGRVMSAPSSTMTGPISTAQDQTDALPTENPAPITPVSMGGKSTVIPVLPQQQ